LQFGREVNEHNGLLLAEDFNNNEKCFEGIYTYPKELYTKDLSVGMKTILKENGIHPTHLNSNVECNNWHHNLSEK
jgi:hypothetical protein